MKECKSCGKEFETTPIRRVVCSDKCKAENKKAGMAERNKRKPQISKKDDVTGVEQAEVRFKNKFLVSNWCGA